MLGSVLTSNDFLIWELDFLLNVWISGKLIWLLTICEVLCFCYFLARWLSENPFWIICTLYECIIWTRLVLLIIALLKVIILELFLDLYYSLFGVSMVTLKLCIFGTAPCCHWALYFYLKLTIPKWGFIERSLFSMTLKKGSSSNR